MFRDKQVICGQVFVDRLEKVIDWEKKKSELAGVRKSGRLGVALPADVTKLFLEKSARYFSCLAGSGEITGMKPIATSSLTALLPRYGRAIQNFLVFMEKDPVELADPVAARTFAALHGTFPKNLDEFHDVFQIFGEKERKIPLTHLPCFTSMAKNRGAAGLAARIKGFWGWLQEKGWEGHLSSISGLLTTKGIPAAGDMALQELMALFGKESGRIPMQHLTHFTSMAHGSGTKGLAARINDFWGWLQKKGWEVHFSSISGLLHTKGIPAAGDKVLQEFMALFGQESGQIPIKHLSHFTSMHNCKEKEGLIDRIKDFWGWLQEKGWEYHFSSISGLLNRKGIPAAGDEARQELEALMALFGQESGQIPMKHLSHFTSMHSCKEKEGLIDRIKDFWGWFQEKGWVDHFSSISGLLSRKGIPAAGDEARQELEALMALFGQESGKIPIKHLSHFTSMHSGKGTEGLVDRIKDFWGWLQKKGWEGHFSSISGLLCAKGIPAADNKARQDLEAFMALFGNEKEQIPMKHLSHFTSMHSCKEKEGLVDRIKDFWGWLQEKGWVDHFSSISGLLSKKGIPAAGNEARQELEAFIAMFGMESGKIPIKHLSHFTSMHRGKGTEGLVDRIKDFWGWLQKKGWEGHLSSISGLLHAKGIPAADNKARQDLEAFMALFGNEKEQIPMKHKFCPILLPCTAAKKKKG